MLHKTDRSFSPFLLACLATSAAITCTAPAALANDATVQGADQGAGEAATQVALNPLAPSAPNAALAVQKAPKAIAPGNAQSAIAAPPPPPPAPAPIASVPPAPAPPAPAPQAQAPQPAPPQSAPQVAVTPPPPQPTPVENVQPAIEPATARSEAAASETTAPETVVSKPAAPESVASRPAQLEPVTTAAAPTHHPAPTSSEPEVSELELSGLEVSELERSESAISELEALASVLQQLTPEQAAPSASEASLAASLSDAETLGILTASVAAPATYRLPIQTFRLPDTIGIPSQPLKHADLELAQSIFDTPPPEAPPASPEAQVLIAEVLVQGPGLTPDLERLVYDTIETRPGQTTTRSQLQEDVNAVYATGFFADVNQVPEDTALGVRITFQVEVNPVLTRVEARTLPEGSETDAVSQEVLDDIFGDGYGEVLNLRDLQLGTIELNDWYQANGYDLAQVVDTQVSPNGVVRLVLAEGVIEDIRVRFIDEEENYVDEDGNPIDGRTREFIVTREMQLEPGDVFNRNTAQSDLQRVFGLGLFEDVRLAFEPGEDPSKVIVNVDVIEGRTGSIAAGAGVSSASGIFGTVSYQQQNLGGNNQTVGAEVQVGERDLLFDVSFTDPWIAGDPYRTSYTVNAFARRSISLIFDEGEPEVRLANGDRPRVIRTGGGINFVRPLAPDPFTRAEWTLSTGFQYQGIRLEDADGRRTPRDSQGNLLSFTEDGRDTLVSLSFGAVRDRRNSLLDPTQGSLLRVGVDQTIPVGSGNIFFNRLRGSYSHYIPVDWLNFTNDPEAPQALAFNLQGGTVIGDLPPYEAFSLGGANSVRGYEEGDVGSGRSYLQATAEYRFPILSFIGGALFLDYATDLGTGEDVPGNPAGVRNKPGDGFGYGVGVRIQSPLGPIRVDYGFNDDGDSRLHFGIGQRF
ncbi:MAG: BamA/TamA family outer membrane protein [Spirulinaceae cyanobacterium]